MPETRVVATGCVGQELWLQLALCHGQGAPWRFGELASRNLMKHIKSFKFQSFEAQQTRKHQDSLHVRGTSGLLSGDHQQPNLAQGVLG